MSTKFDGTETEERALNVQITLQRAADAVQKNCRTFRAEGLTASQFGTLDALYHLGPMHQNKISEKNLKTEANMTTVIDNLEERDLVKRKQDPEDRRCHLVCLTENGRELFESIFPEHVERVVDAVDALTADEQETLIRLCKKLGRANEESNADTDDR